MTALAIAEDREQWLLWRRQGIGGSDAAAVVGEDPFRSALDVFLDKRGYLPLDHGDGGDEPRYWGHHLEPLVIRRFEEDTDLHVVERQSQLVDAKRPWLRATVDGFVSDTTVIDVFKGWTPLGIFEGKTASRRSADWAEGMPLRAQIQVQHELAVSGLDHAWVAVLLTSPVLRFEMHEIERDQAAIDALLEVEADFWQRVLDDNPPPAGAGDVESLRVAYAETDPTAAAVLPASARELLEGLKASRAAVKVAEQQVEYFEAQLMQQLREREVGLIDGEVVITWKGHTKTHVDIDAMRAAHADLVKSFTTQRPYRQMRLVEARSEKGKSE